MRRKPFQDESEINAIPAEVRKRKKAMKAFTESPMYAEFLKLMEAKKQQFKQPLPATAEQEYTYNKANQLIDVIDMVIGFVEEDARPMEGETP